MKTMNNTAKNKILIVVYRHVSAFTDKYSGVSEPITQG